MHFDWIGIPDPLKALTCTCRIAKTNSSDADKTFVIIEGSVDLRTLREPYARPGVDGGSIVSIHADWDVAQARLTDRGQGELASDDMRG